MKAAITSIAAAVGLALASGAAHAALTPPTLGGATTPPTSNDALVLEVWDSSSTASEVVNLGYTFSDISASSGNLTPTAANAAFSTATNPETGTGSVLQLNFGTIANVGSGLTFSDPSTVSYGVFSAATFSESGVGVGATAQTGTVMPSNSGTVNATFITNAQSEVNSMSATTQGTDFDPSCSTTLCVDALFNAMDESGTPGSPNGASISGGLGTALNFYEVDGTRGTGTVTQYGNGFWFLSSAGQLTWNLPESVSAVPLPAAAWLFASGLLGLGLIGRRRAGASA
jgi:hypothetical protein